ncbi:hypothetical protein P879_07763 [Paragonimus westermani]|uniref:Uncharacterized protein n=1 Tax=Paragonimus westermani TaxID=34504 RepID=A0A8T0DG30_9TREM|nr:hypothetical protein P879_07763 [Paragonimus westermani]
MDRQGKRETCASSTPQRISRRTPAVTSDSNGEVNSTPANRNYAVGINYSPPPLLLDMSGELPSGNRLPLPSVKNVPGVNNIVAIRWILWKEFTSAAEFVHKNSVSQILPAPIVGLSSGDQHIGGRFLSLLAHFYIYLERGIVSQRKFRGF